MKQLVFRGCLALAALTILAAIAGWLVLRASLPPDAGRLALPGLSAPAQVHYDRWQRPYVQAATLGDALQVQGWLHASHRLWQMEMLRRAGRGRLAALLGPDLLDTDRELWRQGVPQLARRLQQNTADETLALVDRYLAGVNAAIARYPLLPPEFLLLGAERPRWERRDVFALGALMAYQSANNLDNELLRAALSAHLDAGRFAAFIADETARPDYPFALPPRTDAGALARAVDRAALTDPAHNPRMPRLGLGSNGWVVAGARSDSGAPLFAFDSHDELGLPNLFYEVHLFYGDGRQLRGWSVAGLPGVINGYNEYMAWGFTNIGDTQDLFLEERAAGERLLFRDGESRYRARTETVSIPVKGEADETLAIVHTRNGPLISEDPPISLAWTAHRLPSASLDSLLRLNGARDWGSFNAALDGFPAPALNATYADVHGVIGLRTGGALPLRGAGLGLLPGDGSVADQRWKGMVPAARMPRRSNPPAGFLAAANARVHPPGTKPLVSADNAAPYRIDRIQAVLGGSDPLSAEDMRLLQMDRTDGQAQLLLPTLLQLVERDALAPAAVTALDLLGAWRADPVSAPDSAAALIFQQWYIDLAREVFAAELGELWPRLLARTYFLNRALDHLILNAPGSPWWRGDRGARVTAALNRAVTRLAAEQGGDPRDWRLDRSLHVSPRHALGDAVPALGWLFNLPERSWGGGPSSVGRARYNYTRPFAVDAAATVRVVAELTPVPAVAAVMPGGQSGHPLSPHYDDQYAPWLAGELLPVAPDPARAGEAALVFLPE
ncbi:MAG: penicillin acylase family protein [Halioglobus sp.]|nr:penicillin acylase family protein [Halioglobus sp.]